VILRYLCASCGQKLESDRVVYGCPACSPARSPAFGRPGDAGFRKGTLVTVTEPPRGLAPGAPVDPLAFLPIPVRGTAAFTVGATPLSAPARLRDTTGFANLHLKLDHLNPSGSLKDRASLLVAAQALALGERRVALASTGNAGASMACAGAAFDLEVVLFVPASAPRAKLLQSLLYGARVVPVRGTYHDAFRLSIAWTEQRGGINRNTAYNPLTIEGKKTVSLELWNQLGCAMPDAVYVPTGDGVIIAGVHKGFSDLVAAGLADRLPVLVAVQAQGSNAIARSWREGREVVLERTDTIADSLAVASPANGELALTAIRKSGGRAVEVDDGAISAAQLQLCREAGVFVEPSSAAAWAGFLADRQNLDRSARVVVLLTGTGLKDPSAAEHLTGMPPPCEPRLEAAAALLSDFYRMRP
jgi:threonine synthase